MRLTQKELDLIADKVIMTHSERQKFLKTSGLAKLFGIDYLLLEVEEDTEQPRVPGLLKGELGDAFFEPLSDEELRLWNCEEVEDD